MLCLNACEPPDPHEGILRAVGGAALGRRQVVSGACALMKETDPSSSPPSETQGEVCHRKRALTPPGWCPNPDCQPPEQRDTNFYCWRDGPPSAGLRPQPRGTAATSAAMHGTAWNPESKKVPTAPQKSKPWSIKLTKYIYICTRAENSETQASTEKL